MVYGFYRDFSSLWPGSKREIAEGHSKQKVAQVMAARNQSEGRRQGGKRAFLGHSHLFQPGPTSYQPIQLWIHQCFNLLMVQQPHDLQPLNT